MDNEQEQKDKLVKRRKLKSRLGLLALVLVIAGISAASIWYYRSTRSSDEQSQQAWNGNMQSFGSDIVTASGTTSVGMDVVTFDIDFLEDTTLYVEEVYLSSGDTVAAGDKYVKFTDESIEDARQELESTALSADLTYRSSVISSEESKIQAKYTYDLAMLDASYAEQVYNDTIASLEAELTSALEAYEDAQEEYDEYNDKIVNNTLYLDYDLDELKEAYEDAYYLWLDRKEYWDITDDELSESSSSQGSSPSMMMDEETREAEEDRSWILKTYELLEEEYEEAKEEYEQAQEDYQTEVDGAALKLEQLANTLETAREDYEDALLKYEKQSLSAKTTYETTVAKGETAQNDYETTLTSLEDSLDRLKDAKEEADDNLALFEELIGDGYLYTDSAGTVIMVLAEAGQSMAGDDIILAYSNADELTVSVSVEQDDIAKLTVGETAQIIFTDEGNYTGVIESINPTSSSSSRSSVTYTVTVSIDGDISALSGNLAATVIFGDISMDDMQNFEMPESDSETGGRDMGNMPNMGGGMPDMGGF